MCLCARVCVCVRLDVCVARWEQMAATQQTVDERRADGEGKKKRERERETPVQRTSTRFFSLPKSCTLESSLE